MAKISDLHIGHPLFKKPSADKEKSLPPNPHNYHRSIFISDLHMGHKGFDSRACLSFLRAHECRYLYLVGDIIDGWKLKKRWFWTRDYSLILDELAKKARKGTKIIYIPGNHDDKVRRTNPFRMFRFSRRLNLAIKNVHIHKTADNRKFIVMHGDQFDSALVRGKLSEWGDRLYMFFTERGLLAPRPKQVDLNGKKAKFSLAKAISRTSKKAALSLMNNLERSIFRLVRERNADGLICGHTHVAAQKISHDGIVYYNTGAWMGQKNTALIEHMSGEISLMHYPDHRAQTYDKRYFRYQTPDMMEEHLPETRYIVQKIKKLWKSPDIPQAAQSTHAAKGAKTPLGDDLVPTKI